MDISIHALHYRVRYPKTGKVKTNAQDISIHALHYRVRLQATTGKSDPQPFQSTHSITECDPGGPNYLDYLAISIHALHYRVRSACSAGSMYLRTSFQSTHSITECDFEAIVATDDNPVNFNPRTPLQSAIIPACRRQLPQNISIHALHYRVRSRQPV